MPSNIRSFTIPIPSNTATTTAVATSPGRLTAKWPDNPKDNYVTRLCFVRCPFDLGWRLAVAGAERFAEGYKSSSGPSAHALQISAGDLLDLNVFDTPELSGKLRVDEHGNVSLPLAGVLAVSGMTAEQAGSAIETRLRETDILKDPHVSVAVLEYATQGVTVTGEVKSPGVYPLLGAWSSRPDFRRWGRDSERR